MQRYIFKENPVNDFIFEPKPESDYVSITKLWAPTLSVTKNIKYLIIEVFFGAQITELLSDTSSVQLTKAGTISSLETSKADNGFIGKLSKFIPPSLMTKILERQLCEMLYDKYFTSYGFLINSEANLLPSGSERPKEEPSYSDSTMFRLNKLMTTQLAAYRGKLNFIWTITETFVATLTWISTNSLEITLLLTGLVELMKRFRI